MVDIDVLFTLRVAVLSLCMCTVLCTAVLMESVKASIGGIGMVVTRLTTSNIGSDHNNTDTNTNAANHHGDFVSVLQLCAALCVSV